MACISTTKRFNEYVIFKSHIKDKQGNQTKRPFIKKEIQEVVKNIQVSQPFSKIV